MTETEWHTATDPMPMVEFMVGTASNRKLLLFCLACCRRVERLVPDWPSAELVNVLEQLADGRANPASLPERVHSAWEPEPYTLHFGPSPFDFADAVLEAAFAPCRETWEESTTELMRRGGGPTAVVVHTIWAFEAFGMEEYHPPTTLVPDLRDIFGNPFRPVAFALEWRTSTTSALAQGLYDSRDFSAMAILADALQDAGCDNEEILNHLREPGLHVKGCWALDLVLGKE